MNEIQKLYSAKHWRHVRTHENLADIASRGALPSQLVNNKLWFNGPEWLLLPQEEWPKILPILAPNFQLEERIRIHLIAEPPREMEKLFRFSNFTRLLRVTAYVFRFIYKQIIRKETLIYTNEFLTTSELTRAKHA